MKVTFDHDSIRGRSCEAVSDYQSAGLVVNTRKLAELTAESTNPADIGSLATATILTAAAALEATLSEFLWITNPAAFTKEFRRAGIAGKYQHITQRSLAIDFPATAELVGHRIAISHSEPNNRRSRQFGSRINADGAHWAAETVETFAEAIWGNSMPQWFRNTIRT